MGRHERRLFSTALVIVKSSWDAQDAVQETMYEACAKVSSLRDPERFAAWLSRILVRKCYRLLAATTPTVPFDELWEDCQVVVGGQRDEDVLRAVAELQEEQRVVIALRFFLDLSYRDIEDATGWPMGTVKSRLNRGLGELSRTLSAGSVSRGL